MRTRHGVAALGILIGSVLVVAACSKAPLPASARQDSVVIAPVEPPAAGDSTAMLAWFEQQAAAIDADTLRVARSEHPLALGAGTAGALTAWRDGAIWTRLRVETRGPGFQSNDDYWLRYGVLLGARLTVLRPGRRAAVDHIWFHDMALYRWTDDSGDHLNPAARSTQYEVDRMRTRFDSLMHILSADELTRRPVR